MRAHLLKPFESETKNHFALMLIIRSNLCSDCFRDSNLTTTDFERFFSERDAYDMQFIMANDSLFIFKYHDFFKHLSAYHF